MDEKLRKEIIKWNNKFPVDRWWRQKHKIAFNSKAHQEISFLDQLFEYQEEKIFEEFHEAQEYIPNTGDWIKKQEKTEEQKTLSLAEEAMREMKDLPENFEF
jgi:hypothetical protein